MSKTAPIARRKSFSLKPFIILNIFILFVGLIVIGFFHIILYSRLPNVTEIAVTGVRKIEPNLAVSLVVSDMIMRNHWRAALGPRNILFWAFGEKPNISKRVPQVKSLSVKTDLSAKSVKIEITERTPFAVWCARESACVLADKDGYFYSFSPRAEGFLLLSMSGVSGEPPGPFGRVLSESEWKNIISITDYLKNIGFHTAKVTVRDTLSNEWEIATSQDISMLFRRDATLADVANVIQEVIKKINLKQTNLIDFRVPGKVYYSSRPAGE